MTIQEETDFFKKYGVKPDHWNAAMIVLEYEGELAKLGIGNRVIDNDKCEAETAIANQKNLELKAKLPFLKTLSNESIIGLVKVFGIAVPIHAIWAITLIVLTWILVVKGWRG